MKMCKPIIRSSIVILLILVASCSNSKTRPTTAAFYDYEIQYIRTGMQGVEYLKVFANGKNQAECTKQAQYDAVKAVIFKGIPSSVSPKPLVTEVGAEEKYKDYFNKFFNSGGQYLNYVSLSKDGAIDSNDKFKVGNRLKIGVQVEVKKEDLKKALEKAGIIKTN